MTWIVIPAAAGMAILGASQVVLFADAEAGEDGVEDVLHADRPGDAAEGTQREAQILGAKFWQVGLACRSEAGGGFLQGGAVAGAGQRRRAGGLRQAAGRFGQAVAQYRQSRTGQGADADRAVRNGAAEVGFVGYVKAIGGRCLPGLRDGDDKVGVGGTGEGAADAFGLDRIG